MPDRSQVPGHPRRAWVVSLFEKTGKGALCGGGHVFQLFNTARPLSGMVEIMLPPRKTLAAPFTDHVHLRVILFSRDECSFQCGDQRGKIVRNGVPHQVEINIEVNVNKPVSRCDNIRPGYFGMRLPTLSRDFRCCLAKNLD